jgi:hypothetical protein
VSTLGVLAAAFAGSLIGTLAATALPRLARRRRRRNEGFAGTRPPGDEEGSGRAIGRLIVDVKQMLERVQEDLNTLSDRVARLAEVTPSGAQRPADTGTQPGWSSGRAPLDPRPPLEAGQPQHFGASGAHTRYDPPRSSDPGYSGGYQGDLVLQDDVYADVDLGLGAPAGPPANAVNVEARDDRIVTTSSYPPEAWLQIGPGLAEGRVSLNPAVALNEYALRRLSTFFEWQGARAGATYRTLTPATVRWDDGQRIGILVSRGVARPS